MCLWGAWGYDISSKLFEILKIVGELFSHSSSPEGSASCQTQGSSIPPVASAWYRAHKDPTPLSGFLGIWRGRLELPLEAGKVPSISGTRQASVLLELAAGCTAP